MTTTTEKKGRRAKVSDIFSTIFQCFLNLVICIDIASCKFLVACTRLCKSLCRSVHPHATDAVVYTALFFETVNLSQVKLGNHFQCLFLLPFSNVYLFCFFLHFFSFIFSKKMKKKTMQPSLEQRPGPGSRDQTAHHSLIRHSRQLSLRWIRTDGVNGDFGLELG